jgi:hypothetical protein
MSSFGWTPQAAVYDRFSFDRITPDRILFDYDGPRIFTVEADEGEYLFYLSSEAGELIRYVVAPTNKQTVEDLVVGAKTVVDALDQSIAWILDAKWDGQIVTVWRTTLARVPAGSLPKPGTMLHPDLQPALSLRYTGPSFEPGHMKANVLEAAIRRAISGIRRLGEPNPIVQRLQVGSLELAFAAAEPKDGRNALFRAGSELATETSTLENSLDLLDGGAADIGEIPSRHLEALAQLAMPERSGLNRVEIGGTLFKSPRTFFIDEAKSRKIREALEERQHREAEFEALLPSMRPEVLQGQLRKFDKDGLIFFLKVYRVKKLVKCKFSEAQLEVALHLFANNVASEVSGFTDGKQMLVDNIRPLPALPAI